MEMTPAHALTILSQSAAKANMSLDEHVKAQEAAKVLAHFLNTPKKEPKGASDG